MIRCVWRWAYFFLTRSRVARLRRDTTPLWAARVLIELPGRSLVFVLCMGLTLNLGGFQDDAAGTPVGFLGGPG